MPKFPKGFGRRKSTANDFEDVQESATVEHSFKVFERSDGGSKSFDGGVKLAKTLPATVGRPRTSQRVEENMFEDLVNNNRGSGASNTNTASTTDNSSRLSAASTAPSSTDVSGREESRPSHEKNFSDIPVPPVPKSASTFSLRKAGRSLSWARTYNKDAAPPPTKDLPPTPVEQDSPPGRARAVTASSYASTATPPKLEERDLGLNLGGDFGDMFGGFDKRKSAILLQQEEETRAMSNSPEMLPPGQASGLFSSNRYNQPSPLHLDKSKDVESSPYSWSSQHSQDGLMSNSSPLLFAPQNGDYSPAVPPHGPSKINHNAASSARPQRPGATDDIGLRRSIGARRQSTLDYDEDARLLRESMSASRKMNEPSYSPKIRDSWALPSDKTYKVDDSTISSWNMESAEATPRARKPLPNPKQQEDAVFDSQIAVSANIAQQFQERPSSPPRTYAAKNKVMTPAQFERYRQDQERLNNFGGAQKDEDDEDEIYDDDEDEAEKNRQMAKQRRKQEAHMSVYRQQMMKVTGDQGAATPMRPAAFATQSSPNLANLGKADEGEEEDEEVPLAILQAHGFPNKNKQPMRSIGSNPNLRAQSMVGGADGRLPVFARNLPQDPYFGAGIISPPNRESMSFGGGAASVTGAPTRGLPPGGLVGVIATEERSRAMRRGSPNAQGEYGPIPPPSNGFNGMGTQSPNMMNGMGPMPPMGMNPMMMTPGDQAQIQMSQQMQQFMQMQMQFMQMMTSGQGPPPNGQMPQMPQPPFGQIPRSGSPSIRPSSAHRQQPMAMLDPNAAPWMQQRSSYAPSMRYSGAGYAPSIAPSERSNIGLPGRYRPVSHAPPIDNSNRASTMSGALQGWDKNIPTTKPVKKSGNVSDEDDEEGWEEMAKKREKKKSSWRTKRDTNGFKDLLGFTQ